MGERKQMIHRRVRLTLATTVLVAASTLGLLDQARALEAPVAFSAVAQSTYQTNNVVWKVTQTNGLVIAGGGFTAIRPPGAAPGTNETPRAGLAVFDAATGVPSACAPSFTLPASPAQASVRSLAVSPDGLTLYVGGRFSHVNGVDQPNLAAINLATCTLVSGFRPEPSFIVHALLARGSALYLGGEFNAVAGTARSSVAAVSAVGTVQPGALLSWQPSFDKMVTSLAAQPGGDAIAVGGRFDNVDGGASHALAVVSATSGSVLRRYTGGFVPGNSVVKGLTSDSTGFYTGNEGTGSGAFDGRIAVDWSTLNERWRDGCLGATQAIAVHQSVLYSASHAHDCSKVNGFPDGARHHLLAESVSGGGLLPWYPNTNGGTGESVGPRDLVVVPGMPGPAIWVVGEFTTVNNVAQQGITRFGQSPDAAPVAPTLSLTSDKAGEVRVAWRQAVDNDNATLTYKVFRDGGSTAVHTVTGSSAFWSRRQMTFLDTQPAGTTHTYRVTATDGTTTVTTATRSVTLGGTTSPYAQRVRTDGAQSFWRYDDLVEGFVNDATSNNLPASVRGTVSATTPGAVAGDPSRATTLGGTNTTFYPEVRSSQPSAFTLETWFRTNATDGGKIIGFGNKQTFQSSLADKHVYMRNDGRLVFGVSSGGLQTLNSTASYNDGAWHHLAASQGQNGMALYVDGERLVSNSVTSSLAFDGYWRVGGDFIDPAWPGKPTSEFWKGTLDETAVYPAALSATKVREHYWLGKTGDVVPPSVPQNPVATPSGASVSLSWTASTDDVGVAGYDVYRSATSTVDVNGTPIASDVTGTTFADAPPEPGTWYYAIRARDLAGNRSGASAVASAVVGPVEEQVVTLTPTADAYGNAGAPGTNFGSSSSLLTRGTPGSTSFLRYELPTLPPGKRLVRASLRLRTTTSASAGSADGFPVRFADDTWDEATLTWNNRPPVAGATLGRVQGASSPDTWYDVTLDQTLVEPVLGGRATVALTGEGGDDLQVWSRNFPGFDRRPQLTLTFR
jgi:hypothetical protein